jgi:hypothetical protein
MKPKGWKLNPQWVMIDRMQRDLKARRLIELRHIEIMNAEMQRALDTEIFGSEKHVQH